MFDGGLSVRLLQQFNRDAALPQNGDESIEAAWKRLQGGPWDMSVVSLRRRGGPVFQPASRVDRLLERCANQLLADRLEVRQATRDKIVADLSELLRESTPLRVYRFDIKTFYESIDGSYLLDELRRQWTVPRQVIRVVESAFDAARKHGVQGVPRGFSISSTLAENYLRPFDTILKSISGVYFYARFVDDAIVLTTAYEPTDALVREVDSALRNLRLRRNEDKQQIIDWNGPGQTFDYLGYRFAYAGVGAKGIRAVDIDIAASKVRRFKTKICLALKDHNTRPNLDLLRDRLRLLSSNYIVGQRSEHEALKAGVYYSYKALNKIGPGSGLSELDRFLRIVLFGTRLPISRAVQKSLSLRERRSLLCLSFVTGHRHRRMCKFGRSRMEEIRRCWSHV